MPNDSSEPVKRVTFTGVGRANRISNNRIRTLGSLRNNDGNESGHESDGEGPDRNSFYVGGSEHSGQQVLGPNGPPNDVPDAVFEAARRHGAEAMNATDTSSSSGSRFPRGGHMLGDGVRASQRVGAPDSDSDEEDEMAQVRLCMYEDGFTIDDGPLRSFQDPANREFLQAIMQGQIPPELVRAHPGKEVDLRMERKAGAYVPPPAKPFSGGGQRLGAVVPDVVGAAVAAAPVVAAATPDEAAANMEAAVKEAAVDASQPVTQLQLRLADGARCVAKFNHSHTITAVRTFLVTAFPSLAFAPFQLMTTFPNRVIEDESQSLKDAGLINAVVVVKPTA